MGDTSFYMAPESTVLTQIRAGRVKALGVSSRSRSAQLPDVPTIADQGYPNFEIGLWFGVWAPAGTPDAIVQKINTDINRVLQLAEVKTQYERLGIAIRPMSQQEFTRFVRDEVVKYTRIAKTAQIEPQ
jgi:tripartite-type tricarboxylate transporter receptor subunit TctC